MGIDRPSAANEAGLFRNGFDMIAISNSARRRQCQHGLIDSGATPIFISMRPFDFFADVPAAELLANLKSCTSKTLSTRSASAGSKVFFAGSA
jgi:hypothetical protein